MNYEEYDDSEDYTYIEIDFSDCDCGLEGCYDCMEFHETAYAYDPIDGRYQQQAEDREIELLIFRIVLTIALFICAGLIWWSAAGMFRG